MFGIYRARRAIARYGRAGGRRANPYLSFGSLGSRLHNRAKG